jgi:phage terminase large subunit
VVKGEYVDPDDMISINVDGVDDMNVLRSEVCRIPRKLDNDNGLEQLLSKKEMKIMKIPSPNMADPLMMSMFVPKMKSVNTHVKLNFAQR